MSSQPARVTLPLSVRMWGETHPGQVREANEDSFYCPAKETQGYKRLDPTTLADRGYLLIVADGIGGSDLGQRASREVAQSLRDVYYESPMVGTADQRLSNALQYANDSLYQMRQRNPALGQAGSTVVAAVIHNNQLYLANAGDSRAYLIRAGKAFQRTNDHTVIAEKQARGLPVSEADQGIITRSMGEQQAMPADVYTPTPLQDGDTVLLCSDGLSDMVKEEDLARIVTTHTPKQAARKLVKLANRAGGPDNITVVVAQIGATGASVVPFTLKKKHMIILAAVAVVVLIVWLLAMSLFSARSSDGQNITPAPTTAALPATAPTATEVLAPGATRRPTVTPASSSTALPTPTRLAKQPAGTVDETAMPQTAEIPTVAVTATPNCRPNEFYDPVMGRCRGIGGNGNPSDSTPGSRP